MKDSPTKTICFFHSPRGWGEEEQRVLAACKEEMRKGNKVILIANVHSQLAVKAIQERVDVYRFRLGGLSYLNPLKIGVLAVFLRVKKITAIHFSPADEKFGKLLTTLSPSRSHSK